MPKTKRDKLKGSIATAWLDLERALVQIQEVDEVFDPVHPELAEGLKLVGALLIQSQEMLETFYEVAWGELPKDWTITRERK